MLQDEPQQEQYLSLYLLLAKAGEELRKVSVRMGTVPDQDSEAIREGLRASATKRCLIRVKPEKVVSWDHRKLGGVY